MRKENKRNFKFNIFDLVIILLVLVCATSVVLRYLEAPEWKEKYSISDYRLYFEIDDIKASSYKYFSENAGKTVYMKTSDNEKILLGKLGPDMERGLAIYTYTDSEDESDKVAYYPESNSDSIYDEARCSIKGYIVVKGRMTNTGFLLNGETRLFMDEITTLDIVNEYISNTIKVTDLVKA